MLVEGLHFHGAASFQFCFFWRFLRNIQKAFIFSKNNCTPFTERLVPNLQKNLRKTFPTDNVSLTLLEALFSITPYSLVYFQACGGVPISHRSSKFSVQKSTKKYRFWLTFMLLVLISESCQKPTFQWCSSLGMIFLCCPIADYIIDTNLYTCKAITMASTWASKLVNFGSHLYLR